MTTPWKLLPHLHFCKFSLTCKNYEIFNTWATHLLFNLHYARIRLYHIGLKVYWSKIRLTATKYRIVEKPTLIFVKLVHTNELCLILLRSPWKRTEFPILVITQDCFTFLNIHYISIEYYMAFFISYPISDLGHDIWTRADKGYDMICLSSTSTEEITYSWNSWSGT